MELKNQCCTFEQAKKLRELGVTQDGYFSFVDPTKLQWAGNSIMFLCPTDTIQSHIKSSNPSHMAELAENTYCAFTSAELGELLIVGDDTHFVDTNYKDHLGCWESSVSVRDEESSIGFRQIHEEEGDTEAQVRASMLEYLLENKIINAQA